MANDKTSPVPQPIGLTVYDLPSPVEVAVDEASRTRAGRVRLLLVLLVCAAPVLLSYFTYYVIRPESTKVFGTLISPQRDWPEAQAVDAQGQSVALPSLRGQWVFLVVAAAACDSTCERLLYVQRQLHKSLGKEQDKLERVWLVTDKAPIAAPLQQAIQGTRVLRVDPDVLAQWLVPAAGQQLQDHLYLVDPMGHWMMRFPPQPDASNAMKIKRDLERLLRAASSWDQPGR